MMSQFAQEILAKGKPEWATMVRQEGEQKGRQEGRQEGQAEMLTRLLQHRFGDLPPWASEKIAKAEPPALEEWSLRILDTSTIESVLADPS